jgi:beta-phosphoglucomutase-like phosphatase (HAD superfamily)
VSQKFGVIFDVDGVLINSVPAVNAALDRAFAPYGFKLDDLEGYHRAHSMKMILETVARERNVHIIIDEFRPNLIAILSQLEHVKVDPALLTLVQSLRRHDIPLAVGSSASLSSVERKLAILGLRDALVAVVSGDDVTNHKPAPDVYLQAARLLGVDASRCIIIEDNEIGVEAAHNAGALAVGFGKYNENPGVSFGADRHVSEWSQLSYGVLKRLTNARGKIK